MPALRGSFSRAMSRRDAVLTIGPRRRGGVALAAALVAASGLCLSWYSPSVAAGAPKPVDEVKAAFIYKFASFVRWPDGAFEDDKDPFRIGIVAEDEFVNLVKGVVEGKTVAGRPIRIVATEDSQELADCEIAFLSAAKEDLHEALLKALAANPVLTIGDAANFAKQGGMIRLFEADNRLRFEINLDAAKDADLQISSKLLELASAVFGNAHLEEQ